MPPPLPITFLSDYGYEDEFVGVCHGVIQRIAPGAIVIDIAHGLPRHGIGPAALVLRNALAFMPVGVHLAVVDPGVGTTRRPLALLCADGHLLVGPDNGLLSPTAERLGGAERAIDLSDSPYRLEPVSTTFHGRDVFAPVAGHLALGAALEEAGTEFDPAEVERLELPAPSIAAGRIEARVLYVDRFGNAQLNVTGEQMSAAGFARGELIELDAQAGRHEASYVGTFADAPEGRPLVYEDSYGAVAIAVNRGDAARLLGLQPNASVELVARPAGE